MAVFFFYIFANLIMISMSKAYMHEIENQTQSPTEDNPETEHKDSPPSPASNSLCIAQGVNLVLAIAQSAIIALTSAEMSPEFMNLQSLLDFIFSWVSIVLIGLFMGLEGRSYFK